MLSLSNFDHSLKSGKMFDPALRATIIDGCNSRGGIPRCARRLPSRA